MENARSAVADGFWAGEAPLFREDTLSAGEGDQAPAEISDERIL